MRKIPALLAVLGLAALGLVGCSASGSAGCSRPVTSDSATLGLISVSGAADAVPDVSVHTPFHTARTQFEDVMTGTGTPITASDQLVVLDVSLTSGATGENLVTTPYDGDLSRVFPLSQWVQTFPAFTDALHCATEGSRVVVALAPDDVDSQTAASLGLTQGESSVAVVDVRKVFLPKADGTPEFNDAHNMPTVVRAPDGRPGIIIPDADAPKDLVVQTLLKGSGPVVTGDAPIRVAYTGVTWADRSVFDTTWGDEPKSVTLDSVVPGFASAIKGKTVGSQILVVVPPAQGFGDQEQGGVAKNSTLVYVIDILGIDQAPPAQ